MAMLLHERLADEARRHVVRRLLGEKLGQQVGLRLKPLCVFIGTEQIDHLVAEDGDATRLQADETRSAANLRAQRVEDFA